MRKREILDELLNATEGEHYQFKIWKNQGDLREAAKICCALANCGGGKLILGISDERPRKVAGTSAFPQPERTRLDLMNKLRVGIDFYTYEHNGDRILVFDVASRPLGMPVQIESGTWWYRGDSLVLMPEDIRHAIYDERGDDFSGEICPGATIDDLDSGAIEIFRKKWSKYSGNKRIAKFTAEQLLRDCNAITDDGVTYAALILFGKRAPLIKYRPHAEIVFEYRSSEAAGLAAQSVDFHDGFFNKGNHPETTALPKYSGFVALWNAPDRE
jgi:ATP-dependent DNA helicase RecG